MQKIILITYAFPYFSTEPFLETEIQYWEKREDIQLIIMPTVQDNYQRNIPENIFIEPLLANKFNKISNKMLYMLKSLSSSMLYRELLDIIIKNPKAILRSLYSHAKYLFYKNKLEDFLKLNKNEDIIFYTYWYTEITYALQTLKNQYTFELVTRVHGSDLYEDRKPYGYMPFRKQFLKNIDKIYTITNSANRYLSSTYGFNKNMMETSRLGVNDHNIITSKNNDFTFHIVSCSNLIELKQIDKLMDALLQLSLNKKEFKIKWTHIGSGILDEKLKLYAKKYFVDAINLSYHFLGQLNNEDVYNFYRTNNVDVFINVSSSEGVPVTIMEAMSCHIPVIAPDIGGISDMVANDYNGVLMSQEPSINEISESLGKIDLFKNDECRNNAYKVFKEKYNAKINYVKFIDGLSTYKEIRDI